MGEPREPLPPEPSLEEFKAQHKAYARAVAAGDEIKIPPYPHPRERKPS
jgi:hypothetical protein